MSPHMIYQPHIPVHQYTAMFSSTQARAEMTIANYVH